LSATLLSSRLSICIFVPSSAIVHSLTTLLSGQKYHLHILNSATELSQFVLDHKEKLDCLIIAEDEESIPIIQQFYDQGVILPVIILDQSDSSGEDKNTSDKRKTDSEIIANQPTENHLYHSAEVHLQAQELENINKFIDKALARFLHLAPSCSLSENPNCLVTGKNIEEKQNFLLLQQRRLAEKLKERLGYLGVYYKRNPNYFYRHLSSSEQDELIEQLNSQYRAIILDYFHKESNVNQLIDDFVNQAFFADISVSQILEIHMDLMDEFAQQLKLEGRNEEILLDYRLTLIDLIAHLCEMYRRSIPKEDIPFDVLFPVD
jgi:circadian clock protein KaiA